MPQQFLVMLQGPVLNALHEIRTEIKDDVKAILGKLHHIPAADTDQCALSRLGLSALFGQKQPFNLKSTSCQIQASAPETEGLPMHSALHL